MKRIYAFTLIELLVVIMIICILAGMLFPVTHMIRESSRKTSCGNNQRQIVLEILNFVQTNQAWPGTKIGLTGAQLVPDTGFNPLILINNRLGMTLTAKTFICPSNTKPKDKTLVSYAYNDSGSVGPKLPVGRIIIADRISKSAIPLPSTSTGMTFHGNLAITVSADGSIGTIKGVNGVYKNPDDAGIDIASYLVP